MKKEKPPPYNRVGGGCGTQIQLFQLLYSVYHGDYKYMTNGTSDRAGTKSKP